MDRKGKTREREISQFFFENMIQDSQPENKWQIALVWKEKTMP